MKPSVLNKKKYLYGHQTIEEDDLQAVLNVLKSDWLTQGPHVGKFQEELSKVLGFAYATAMANGTAALHMAAVALGWKPGDFILTSPLSFVATSNCILYAGATPDF